MWLKLLILVIKLIVIVSSTKNNQSYLFSINQKYLIVLYWGTTLAREFVCMDFNHIVLKCENIYLVEHFNFCRQSGMKHFILYDKIFLYSLMFAKFPIMAVVLYKTSQLPEYYSSSINQFKASWREPENVSIKKYTPHSLSF